MELTKDLEAKAKTLGVEFILPTSFKYKICVLKIRDVCQRV